MAGKKSHSKKGKRNARAKPRKNKGARRASGLKSPAATIQLVNAGAHDLTNLATAVKAYLELLGSQSVLDPKQKYYVDRAREQVEMMVDLVRELREKVA